MFARFFRTPWTFRRPRARKTQLHLSWIQRAGITSAAVSEGMPPTSLLERVELAGLCKHRKDRLHPMTPHRALQKIKRAVFVSGKG